LNVSSYFLVRSDSFDLNGLDDNDLISMRVNFFSTLSKEFLIIQEKVKV
jgi:hypothetical protein